MVVNLVSLLAAPLIIQSQDSTGRWIAIAVLALAQGPEITWHGELLLPSPLAWLLDRAPACANPLSADAASRG